MHWRGWWSQSAADDMIKSRMWHIYISTAESTDCVSVNWKLIKSNHDSRTHSLSRNCTLSARVPYWLNIVCNWLTESTYNILDCQYSYTLHPPLSLMTQSSLLINNLNCHQFIRWINQSILDTLHPRQWHIYYSDRSTSCFISKCHMSVNSTSHLIPSAKQLQQLTPM